MLSDESLGNVGPTYLIRLWLLVLATTLLFVATSCGGGSNGPTAGGSGGGGGGGGGGGNAPPCTFSQANGTQTSGAGVGTTLDASDFGMHLNSQNAPWPFFNLGGSTSQLNFGSQRLWDAGVSWVQVNTTQGVYDWSKFDSWLSSAQSHGVTDELYVLARTPQWASSDPNDTSCLSSGNLGGGQCHAPVDLSSDGSGTDAIWISWVSAVAQHSAARKAAGELGINSYEIWNEWNIANSWVGTPAQLIRMEQDARCVVGGPPTGLACNPNSSFPSGTGLDPGARIVTPSPVSAHTHLDAVSTSLSTYFQTQVNGFSGGTYADAIGFHGYVGTASKASTNAVPCPVAEDVNTVIANMNSTIAANPGPAAGKLLFNTEGGWSKADDEGFTDQDRQAAFLPRYILLQQSSGINRLYWYAWDSARLASLYNDTTGQSTKAATAYGEVNNWTVGATVTSACTESGTVWSCGFSRPNGYLAVAVWDASQDCTSSSCPTTSFTIPSGGYIEYRDVAGNVTQLSGAGTVQIGAKPILLETAPLP